MTPDPPADLAELLQRIETALAERPRERRALRLDSLKVACLGVTFSIAVGFVILAVQQLIEVQRESEQRDRALRDTSADLANRLAVLEARLGDHGPPLQEPPR